MSVWQIIALVVIVAAIVAVIASWRTRRKDIKKVAYMMDALEDGELNFRFQENSRFNRTLNRIRTIFEKQRQAHEQDSWTKLIRVLTHEIMNTVSPIASLSDAMAKSDHLRFLQKSDRLRPDLPAAIRCSEASTQSTCFERVDGQCNRSEQRVCSQLWRYLPI